MVLGWTLNILPWRLMLSCPSSIKILQAFLNLKESTVINICLYIESISLDNQILSYSVCLNGSRVHVCRYFELSIYLMIQPVTLDINQSNFRQRILFQIFFLFLDTILKIPINTLWWYRLSLVRYVVCLRCVNQWVQSSGYSLTSTYAKLKTYADFNVLCDCWTNLKLLN